MALTPDLTVYYPLNILRRLGATPEEVS